MYPFTDTSDMATQSYGHVKSTKKPNSTYCTSEKSQILTEDTGHMSKMHNDDDISDTCFKDGLDTTGESAKPAEKGKMPYNAKNYKYQGQKPNRDCRSMITEEKGKQAVDWNSNHPNKCSTSCQKQPCVVTSDTEGVDSSSGYYNSLKRQCEQIYSPDYPLRRVQATSDPEYPYGRYPTAWHYSLSDSEVATFL